MLPAPPWRSRCAPNEPGLSFFFENTHHPLCPTLVAAAYHSLTFSCIWVWTSGKKQAPLGSEGRTKNTFHHEFDTRLRSNTEMLQLDWFTATTWESDSISSNCKTVVRKEKSILRMICGETASWSQDSDLRRRDPTKNHVDKHNAAIFSFLFGCRFERKVSVPRDSWT